MQPATPDPAMTTIRRLVTLAILLVACLVPIQSAHAISYLPPGQTDPNQAQMVDLLGHVNQLYSTIAMYEGWFPGNRYFIGEADVNFQCWSLVNDEVGYPTNGNLWDVGASVAVGLQNALFNVSLTGGDPYWEGVASELQSIAYWCSYEENQPGVVRP